MPRLTTQHTVSHRNYKCHEPKDMNQIGHYYYFKPITGTPTIFDVFGLKAKLIPVNNREPERLYSSLQRSARSSHA